MKVLEVVNNSNIMYIFPFFFVLPAKTMNLTEDELAAAQRFFNSPNFSGDHFLFQNVTEDPYDDNFVQFITEGVLLIIISLLGFIGNSMSIYVLLRPTVRGSFIQILISRNCSISHIVKKTIVVTKCIHSL